MFTNQDFIRLLSIEQGVIESQTEGLSQEDTLIQPQPSGNCMNWVLGHTLSNQIEILRLLGVESPIPYEEMNIYQRESDPITAAGPNIQSLEQLLAGHKTLHELLVARLAEMSDEEFSREIPYRDRTTTIGWRLLFLNFHYTYHVGQLELLRQLAGRTEKVI